MQPTFPFISKELVDELNTRFPERCPDPGWTDRDVWIKTGERQVARFLINKFNEQVKSAMDKKVKV